MNRFMKEDAKALTERGHSLYAVAYQLKQDYGGKLISEKVIENSLKK